VTAAHTEMQPLPGTCWRPWGVDALATVVARDPRSVTIRYDHAPKVTHTLTRGEYSAMGREVNRPEYERGKRRDLEALDRLHEKLDELPQPDTSRAAARARKEAA